MNVYNHARKPSHIHVYIYIYLLVYLLFLISFIFFMHLGILSAYMSACMEGLFSDKQIFRTHSSDG